MHQSYESDRWSMRVLQAFKSYDEAGNRRRVSCLKYLVLSNMLAKKDMDPFNAQETKPYKNGLDSHQIFIYVYVGLVALTLVAAVLRPRNPCDDEACGCVRRDLPCLFARATVV